MKKLVKIAWALLLISQTANAEQTVEAKLLEFNQIIESTRFSSGDRPNYQVTNACFYTIYREWSVRYFAILKTTPLDDAKISSLNIYSQFAASIGRDIHLLEAYYPNLFSGVVLYVQQKRRANAWPQPPQNITLSELDNVHLGENLAECYNSRIADDLADSVSQADQIAGNRALNDVIKVTFSRNQQGGLELEEKWNRDASSNIPGVITSSGTDSFKTPIPASNK